MSLRRSACRSCLFLGVSLFALPVVVPSAFAVKQHRPKRRLADEQIQQLESQWRSAAMSGDTVSMDRLLSDDYLGITASGDLLTKQQQLERMRTRQFILTRMDPSELKVKLIGQIAIVTSLAEIDGVSNARPIHGTFRYTRIYKHAPSGAWKVTSFEITRVPANRAVPSDTN